MHRLHRYYKKANMNVFIIKKNLTNKSKTSKNTQPHTKAWGCDRCIFVEYSEKILFARNGSDFLGKFGQYVEQIADDGVVGHFHNRGVFVFVDGDD